MAPPAENSGFPAWLLRSRIAPPRQLRQLVERPRIGRFLDKARPGQIVLACAPPGFGKSVALAQWAGAFERKSMPDFVIEAALLSKEVNGADVAKRGRRTAWLSIDAADDPATLLEYLRVALHGAGLQVLRASGVPANPTLELQALLAGIEGSAAHWVLVLDDVERASLAVHRDVIDPLCRFLPDNAILALATRETNLLDLSSHSERGLLLTLSSDVLRFDRDEVQLLWGASATRAQVRTVEQRSGGWPALLQVMLEQGSRSYFETASTAAGSATAAAGFFEARLLARLEEPVREALLRLSLLVSFPPSIARELLKSGPSELEAMLGRLSTLGVLSRTETATGIEYAVYPLVRDYLAMRFTAQEPASARELHRDAAHVYLRHGDFVAATRHAAAVGDDALLADIVESVEPLMLGVREGFPRLRQILRLVPDTMARERPRIGYACIANNIKVGRLKDAEGLFLEMEARAKIQIEAYSSPVVQFERAMALSLLAVYKGTPIGESEFRAFDTFPASTPLLAPIVRSLVETLRSFVWQLHSRFGEAERASRLSTTHAEEAGSPYAAYFNYCDLGMFAGVQGRLEEAFDLFDTGDRLCASTVRTDERLSSIRDAFRLELEHEAAAPGTSPAARLKNVCIRLPSLEGWPDIYSAAFRTFSEQLFLSGDLSGALAILEVGLDYLNEQEIIGAPVVLMAQRAMLLALAGRLAEARTEFEGTAATRLPAKDLLARPWRESEALIEAEAAIALAAGEAGSQWLPAGIRFAGRHGNARSEMRFRTWQRSLASANCTGARSPADVGRAKNNERRLEALLRATQFNRTAELTRNALASQGTRQPAIRRGGLKVVPTPVRSPFYMTPREFDVIACLERGLSDKAIAKELSITAHGVRYHLKRIYAKLHVKDRAEARRKAGKLGVM